MKTLFFLFITFTLSFNAYAKKELILIGGGGEPFNAKDKNGKSINGTIFDYALQALSPFVEKSMDWEKQMSFNGGHPETDQILATNFSNIPNVPFTEASYLAVIKKYEDQLTNGELKKGDQILLIIDSHGALNKTDKKIKEETHSISTTKNVAKNKDTLGASGLVSLDELKRITKLAKEKGVKVGIIDQSCHSGNTLALGDENTCVLTTTGPNHYAWAGTTTTDIQFNKNLATEKNLEEVFLKSRREATGDSGFAMISSPTGQKVQDKIYEVLTPYLYRFDSAHDKLTPYFNNSSGDIACKYEENFKQLTQVISEVEGLKNQSLNFLLFQYNYTTKEVDLSELKKSLEDYYNFQIEIAKKVDSYKKIPSNPNLNLNGKISFTSNDRTSVITYGVKELLSIDFDRMISDANARNTNSMSDNERKDIKANLEIMTKAQAKAKEIKEKFPGITTTIESVLSSFADKETISSELAVKIAAQSKILYDALYKKEASSQENMNQPNPCRDFVL